MGHMAAGLPILAFLHTASDGHALIRDAQCGVSADSADPQACLDAIKSLMLRRSEFNALGQAGKRYATEHFSKEVCVSQMEALLNH